MVLWNLSPRGFEVFGAWAARRRLEGTKERRTPGEGFTRLSERIERELERAELPNLSGRDELAGLVEAREVLAEASGRGRKSGEWEELTGNCSAIIQLIPLGLKSASHSSINLSDSARSFATGFSLTTCFPAFHACSIIDGWTRIGRERMTVWISGRARRSAREAPGESSE